MGKSLQIGMALHDSIPQTVTHTRGNGTARLQQLSVSTQQKLKNCSRQTLAQEDLLNGVSLPVPGASVRRQFSSLTWNMRGLLHHNRALRARKIGLLFSVATDFL